MSAESITVEFDENDAVAQRNALGALIGESLRLHLINVDARRIDMYHLGAKVVSGYQIESDVIGVGKKGGHYIWDVVPGIHEPFSKDIVELTEIVADTPTLQHLPIEPESTHLVTQLLYEDRYEPRPAIVRDVFGPSGILMSGKDAILPHQFVRPIDADENQLSAVS